MVAYPYRMGGGIAGDVNRTHPAQIEPNVNDGTNPASFYGQAVVYTATGTVRTVIATDTALTTIAGITVRPFPVQQSTTTQDYGAQTIGSAGIGAANALDVLKQGYMTVTSQGSPVKGGTVYVWIAASTGNHVQGGFEAAASGTNTIALSNAYFNSQADAAGNCEVAFGYSA